MKNLTLLIGLTYLFAGAGILFQSIIAHFASRPFTQVWEFKGAFLVSFLVIAVGIVFIYTGIVGALHKYMYPRLVIIGIIGLLSLLVFVIRPSYF